MLLFIVVVPVLYSHTFLTYPHHSSFSCLWFTPFFLFYIVSTIPYIPFFPAIFIFLFTLSFITLHPLLSYSYCSFFSCTLSCQVLTSSFIHIILTLFLFCSLFPFVHSSSLSASLFLIHTFPLFCILPHLLVPFVFIYKPFTTCFTSIPTFVVSSVSSP